MFSLKTLYKIFDRNFLKIKYSFCVSQQILSSKLYGIILVIFIMLLVVTPTHQHMFFDGSHSGGVNTVQPAEVFS